MKYLFLLVAFGSQMANAQITLEHLYFSNLSGGGDISKVDSSEWDYYSVSGNSVSIYSLNHSLISTIPLSIPSSAKYWGSSYLSKNLFTTDNRYVIE